MRPLRKRWRQLPRAIVIRVEDNENPDTILPQSRDSNGGLKGVLPDELRAPPAMRPGDFELPRLGFVAKPAEKERNSSLVALSLYDGLNHHVRSSKRLSCNDPIDSSNKRPGSSAFERSSSPAPMR